MNPNLPPEARTSPLERLETAVDSMTLAQQENTNILKGLEPVMEALIESYVHGTQEVKQAIASIEDYVSKIEPVSVNQNAVAAIAKLNKIFSKPDLFKMPEPQVIAESKETVKAIRDLIETVDSKPMEFNVENDFTKLEKALGRIEKLIKIEIPIEDGRVKVKLSDADLKRIGEGLSFPISIGTASEDTLAKIPGLSIPIHDSVYATYPTSSTEKYTYKLSGRTVATVDVIYTDSTKATLTSVIKS